MLPMSSLRYVYFIAALLLPSADLRSANEVGFIERFALAADRAKVLQELVPGTEDFFFFHALHFQNIRDEKRLEETLAEWTKQTPDETERRRIILNREALLHYPNDPKGTIAYLKDRLGVELDHERETPDAPSDLPEKLDAALVSRDAFEREALAKDSALETLLQSALARLVAQPGKLKPEQRKVLLQRIQRPDVKGLVELIIADLDGTDGTEFGSAGIHHALLPEQLDALEKKLPALKASAAFVNARMRKLAPRDDENIHDDALAREAWLDRLWSYVETLPQSFDSLKAGVLCRRLDHDRGRGVYDVRRLIQFLKLPRRAAYSNAQWLAEMEARRPLVSDSFLNETALERSPADIDVDALVREYFLAILAKEGAENPDAEGWRKYTEWVSEAWLKPVFAEAMLTHGIGEPAKWASYLSEDAFQQLKDRVDIEFPATNAQFIKPGEDVSFDVVVKNTPKLLVRVFELNALNFYLQNDRELDANIDLAGLVATSEGTESFETGPFVRKQKTFSFPGLKDRRGAWVVELIGGGRSSRALIRVGQWQVNSKAGVAGMMISVFDENRRPVPDAVAWLEGRKFTHDPVTGLLVIPFSTQPGERALILSDADGTFASRTEFEHQDEKYGMGVSFHIEREQLLARRRATIAVQPSLFLGSMVLDPAMLEESKLTLHFVSHDSIASRVEFTDLKLRADAVSTFEFQVPDRLANVTAILSGKVTSVSKGGEKQALSEKFTWKLNKMDTTDAVAAGLLSKSADGYFFELRGRNGEAMAGRQVEFDFHHRDYGPSIKVSMRTDAKGRISLGGLADISSIYAESSGMKAVDWSLRDYQRLRPANLNVLEGDEVRIPLPPGTWPPELSLLEKRGDTFVANLAAKMDSDAGFLVIRDLPAGNYSLGFRNSDETLKISVVRGIKAGNWLLGERLMAESLDTKPLQITDVSADKDNVTVKLANVNSFTRVHISATRFVPETRLFDSLSDFRWSRPESFWGRRMPNQFSREREIGDEYRYILERRAMKIYAGNMLARPGLIVNPWQIEDVASQALSQKAAKDMMNRPTGGLEAVTPERATAMGGRREVARDSDANLDFLADPAPVLYNLVPDKDRVIRIDRKALGDRYFVQVYAEDLTTAVQRNIALPERPTVLFDRRLSKGLDPARAFAEKREVTVLGKGESLVIADILTSELETYDSLARIHGLLATLNPDAPLADFAWLLEWPNLKDEERLAKYSEYACHEVNFFLSRKQPEFFEKVIKPHLANKKDRTFMDDYLLGNDLAAYLEPTAYARLNALECALLGTRIAGEGANAFRRLREQCELIPQNPAADEALFETALRGRALAGADGGVVDAIDALKERLADMADSGNAAPAKEASVLGRVDAEGKQAKLQRGFGRSADRGETQFAEREQVKTEELRRFVEAKGGEAERFGSVASPREMAEKIVDLRFKAKSDPKAKELLDDFARAPQSSEWFALAGATNGIGKNVTWDADGDGTVSEFAFTSAAAVRALRESVRSFYRAMGTTREFAEHNYYRRRIADQGAALVPVNAFWRDFARHVADGQRGPFVSPHIAQCCGNLTEMLLALAVLDLPLTSAKHETKAEGSKFTLTASGPVIVFHKQIAPATPAKSRNGALLVAQSFYRHDDRYEQEENEQSEKYVTGEFLSGVVYGANVVVTNPTASTVKADVLTQIPEGAIPVLGSKATFSRKVRLNPFSTERFEYAFYFPAQPAKAGGRFAHYPVNASVPDGGGGAAKPVTFKVVARPTVFDRGSWDFVSQRGTNADVFAFLAKNNLAALDFSRVAWRCKEPAFFRKLSAFMKANQVQDETIASYALNHNDPTMLREWLLLEESFLGECGPWLSSPIAEIDPIARRAYEHLEYSPLINQRAHQLGTERRIANPEVLKQYTAFLDILAHKPALDAADAMGVVYYLFLQDRVEESLERFHAVDAKALPVQIQYDYFACYAALYESRPDDARGIAVKYANHPVARWKSLFAEVSATLDEIEGKAAASSAVGVGDREKRQNALAERDAAFDLKIENAKLGLTYRNLDSVTVDFHLIDLEFAFSNSPFAQGDAARAGWIKPRKSEVMPMPQGKTSHEIPIPAEFANANVLVEVAGGGLRKSQPYHSHSMKLAIAENFGRMEVRALDGGDPIDGAYVKVYARLRDGGIRFYKDGYTDRRGRFDYASINGNEARLEPMPSGTAEAKRGLDHQTLKHAELGSVEALSILILSAKNGSVVREVLPPRE